MGRVTGIKEKLHSPLYDAIFVDKGKPFRDAFIDPRILRFFVDVQNKTRLETNLQAAGVLPSLNTFEVRAMRVVISSKVVIDDATGEVENDDTPFFVDFIFSSVTSLLVGEKEAISVPTYLFPSGAGVSPGNLAINSHGNPDPMATFRFAEPVFIEPQQNFRVEILFPHGIPDRLEADEEVGPRRIWVVLDGYLTRDVQ
jgi:hypothetical protein